MEYYLRRCFIVKRKRQPIGKAIHLPKRTKRYNGVYDPEFEPSVQVMLANEMTGAIPAAPKTDFAEEAYEDLTGTFEQ